MPHKKRARFNLFPRRLKAKRVAIKHRRPCYKHSIAQTKQKRVRHKIIGGCVLVHTQALRAHYLAKVCDIKREVISSYEMVGKILNSIHIYLIYTIFSLFSTLTAFFL